jgi:hypothetical protein
LKKPGGFGRGAGSGDLALRRPEKTRRIVVAVGRHDPTSTISADCAAFYLANKLAS